MLLLLLQPHLFDEVRIKNNNTAKVIFFEDGTGVITNDTSLRVQFNYTFTEGAEEGLNYTQHGIVFPNEARKQKPPKLFFICNCTWRSYKRWRESAYAQKEQQACPPNSSLEKGYCIYEATPAPVSCEDGFELVNDDTLCKTIEPTRYHMAFCPSGYEVGYYTHPDYGFTSFCIPVGGHPPFTDDELADPTCDTLVKAPNEIVVLENYDAPVFGNDTICAFYETAEPTPQGDPTCDNGGVLFNGNDCRVRPGRNNA